MGKILGRRTKSRIVRAPEYGPESPREAVDRLLEYYQKLSPVDHVGFVAALIGEVVTLKVMQRSMQKREA